MKAILAVSFATALLLGIPAAAAPVRVEFAGSLDEQAAPLSDLFSTGQRFSGFYSYDSDEAPLEPEDSPFQSYQFNSFSLTIGSLEITALRSAQPFRNFIGLDDYSDFGIYSVQISELTAEPESVGGYLVDAAVLQFNFDEGLDNLSLASALQTLAEGRFARFMSLALLTGPGIFDRAFLFGTIDSVTIAGITDVPEPAALGLLGMGLLGLTALRRRHT